MQAHHRLEEAELLAGVRRALRFTGRWIVRRRRIQWQRGLLRRGGLRVARSQTHARTAGWAAERVRRRRRLGAERSGRRRKSARSVSSMDGV